MLSSRKFEFAIRPVEVQTVERTNQGVTEFRLRIPVDPQAPGRAPRGLGIKPSAVQAGPDFKDLVRIYVKPGMVLFMVSRNSVLIGLGVVCCKHTGGCLYFCTLHFLLCEYPLS